ncbi:MAG TPA: riboflavin synthase [Gemmatimonadales bacterium]|jgi:riboflavin synthase|nr:riboflavin synthase [Gemmatimonadales bacterium]
MFTGIVTAVGRVRGATTQNGGLELAIEASYDDLALGESVAVDGACLTVKETGPGWFGVHVVATSLDRTAIGRYTPGRRVNLERALRVGDRLGGHLVQGHVDGTGVVLVVAERADARLLDIRVPPEVAAVSIPLGSITVDGVSLTVNARPAPDVIQVSLIPFTLQETTLGERVPGDQVQLEGDTIGKYVAAMLQADSK